MIYLSHSKAEFILHRTRQKYYFESERPSHLLALRLKECESKAYISAIKSSDDQVTTNPVAINDIFIGFYTNLYKAETDFDEPICKQYLDKLELPRISQMDKESLEAPLSLEELHVSLKSLQKGKSPGLDGLPPELYLEIWDLVGIPMLNSFNFAIEHGVFRRDQKTSLILLLLKKGKNPLDCSSYRPISLIPCDLKIYAKVFASRMEKVIHSLIKEDQTGFIKGRNASDNMRRLLHILDFADSHPTPCAVFSLDVEKAFDRLEWNYMWAVLQCFGFGEHFISMIKTLYHSPAASVITGNIISPSFPLQRGTRQGCPLSPLLFCLSLEPLAQAIRKSEVSIKIHDHNHSISLYADDMMMRVGGARPSTIDAWQCFLMDIRDCIKEWLLCFYCPSLSPSLLIGPWDVECVSVVLFCYILDVMLCYVWIFFFLNLLITKKIKCLTKSAEQKTTRASKSKGHVIPKSINFYNFFYKKIILTPSFWMVQYKSFLFQINADLWIFLFIKESWKNKYSTVLNIENNNNINVSWKANQHIRMISDGPCDTEDWSNDAENSTLITGINYILRYIQIESSYFI